MFKSVKLNAEEQFAATQKKDMKAREEKEVLQQEKVNRIANLRALRLAKEVADKKAADMAAAEKLTAKNVKIPRSA